MKYVSHEDKQLQLPFSLSFKKTLKTNGNYDFTALFKLNKQIDMSSDESYYPLIRDV